MADGRSVESSIPKAGGAPAPIWQKLRFDAQHQASLEPALASYLNATVLNHDSFAEALSYHLAQKAGGPDMSALAIREICADAYRLDPAIVAAAERDLGAYLARAGSASDAAEVRRILSAMRGRRPLVN